MKTYGKVIEYNGYNGYVRGIDGQDYLIMNREVMNEIKLYDKVSFEADCYKTSEANHFIARYIRPLQKDDNKMIEKRTR